jgi:hypothetical protein
MRATVCIALLTPYCLAVLAATQAPQVVSQPTITIAVHATDSSGGALHYKWKSTDGAVQSVDAPTTTWTPPAGPGLHFVYVLVTNGFGGYTERRVAINTDNLGIPVRIPAPRPLAAPPAPAQAGDFYEARLGWYSTVFPDGNTHDAPAVGVPAYLSNPDLGTVYPSSGYAISDVTGKLVFSGVPAGEHYMLNCSIDGGASFQDCTPALGNEMLAGATSDYFSSNVSPQFPYNGSFVLADGSACGTQDEFFGIHDSPTATLMDTHGHHLATFNVDELGTFSVPPFSVPFNPDIAFVSLKCDKKPAIKVPVNPEMDLGQTAVTGVTPPTIVSMTATLSGKDVGIFLPPPTGLPSDVLTRSDGFLGEKGLDSRLGACQYYKAIGAVQDCNSSGHFIGAISFEDWKRTVKIDKYNTAGDPQYEALYINQMDLNLARHHKSIFHPANSQTAAVVCNHLGPPFNLVTPQADIDTAVANAANGKNLVACVAMDYTVTPGVNNEKPFIRFLIFGPSGQLLPSINLDGRSEKFVPGTCVVCHGGDHYAGKYPEDGSGPANVGGHFLPYDTGNFLFSSQAGLREADQEEAIYRLNQNVLTTGPTQAEKDLIAGW